MKKLSNVENEILENNKVTIIRTIEEGLQLKKDINTIVGMICYKLNKEKCSINRAMARRICNYCIEVKKEEVFGIKDTTPKFLR